MKRLIALILSLLMVFALIACDSKDDDDDDDRKKTLTVDDVMENLEEAGYFLEIIKDEKSLEYEIDSICDGFDPEGKLTTIIEAANFETDEFVRVYFFEKTADAKELKILFDKYAAAGENTGEYKQQEKIFIVSKTEQGINDALGKKSSSSIGGIGGGIIGGGTNEDESSSTGIGGGSNEDESSNTGIGGGSIGGNVTQESYLDKAQQNLEKAGYSVTVSGSPDEGGRALTASSSVNGLTIVIAEFSKEEDAVSYYNEMLSSSASNAFPIMKIYGDTVVLATGIDILNVAEGKTNGGGFEDQEPDDSTSSIVDDEVDTPKQTFNEYSTMLEINLYTEDSISIMSLLDGLSAQYGISFCGDCNNYLYAAKFMDHSGANYEYANLVYVLDFEDQRDAQNLYTAIMNDSNYGPECVHIDPNGYIVVIGNNPTALYEACHVTDKIDPLLDAIDKNDTDLIRAFFIDMKEAILNTSEHTIERDSTVYTYADAFIINSNIYIDEGNRELAGIFLSIGEDMYKMVEDEQEGQEITEDTIDEMISDAVDRIFSFIENTESNLIMN